MLAHRASITRLQRPQEAQSRYLPILQLHDLPPARVARLGGASAVDHHVRRVHARVVAPPPAQVAAHLPACGRKRQGRRLWRPGRCCHRGLSRGSRGARTCLPVASRGARGGPEPQLWPRAPPLAQSPTSGPAPHLWPRAPPLAQSPTSGPEPRVFAPA